MVMVGDHSNQTHLNVRYVHCLAIFYLFKPFFPFALIVWIVRFVLVTSIIEQFGPFDHISDGFHLFEKNFLIVHFCRPFSCLTLQYRLSDLSPAPDLEPCEGASMIIRLG